MSQVTVEWTEAASTDLVRVYNFLAEKNVEVAQNALEIINRRSLLLEQYPELGTKMRKNFRRLFIPFGSAGYILLYQVIEDRIFILRVWHTKEKPKV